MPTTDVSTQSKQDALADEARALIAATAEVAGEKVAQARQRLSTAIHEAEAACGRLGERALLGAKAADHTVREHPYTMAAAAFGVGAVIGFLLTRRGCK
jgi:ElaB/YqjD/DUF883 family membrane-anchored ribosome-binding protein